MTDHECNSFHLKTFNGPKVHAAALPENKPHLTSTLHVHRSNA